MIYKYSISYYFTTNRPLDNDYPRDIFLDFFKGRKDIKTLNSPTTSHFYAKSNMNSTQLRKAIQAYFVKNGVVLIKGDSICFEEHDQGNKLLSIRFIEAGNRLTYKSKINAFWGLPNPKS